MNLFELFGTLGMDTAQFDAAVLHADESGASLARHLTETMGQASNSLGTLATTSAASLNTLSAAGQSCASRLSSAMTGAWGSITAAVQQAIDRVHTFLNMRGVQQITLRVSGAEGVRGGVEDGGLQRMAQVDWQTGVQRAAFVQQADLSALPRLMAEAMQGVAVQMDGETVGTLVAPAVSAAMGSALRGRRWVG